MKKKKFKAIELNHLDKNTLMQIREWRNQDFVRTNMFHSEIIQEDEHVKWIEKVKKDPNQYVFVFYLDDLPFGVELYNYNPETDCVEIGNYLISEEYQALGYGTILTYFGGEIIYRHLGYKKVYAEILNTNERAMELCKSTGLDIEVGRRIINSDGTESGVYIVKEDWDFWEKVEKGKLEKIVFKFVEQNYEVII